MQNNRRTKALLATVVSLLLFAFACSPPDGDSDADAADTADPTTDASDVLDTLEDAAPDSGAGDTSDDTGESGSDADTGNEPKLASFRYVRETANCSRNCIRGVGVNLLRGQIKDIDDRTDQETMDWADVQELRDAYLTDEVYRKMKNGWDCGSQEKLNSVFHRFSAVDNANSDRLNKLVAGCIPNDSTKPDAELVHRIVDKLQSLKNEYFNN